MVRGIVAVLLEVGRDRSPEAVTEPWIVRGARSTDRAAPACGLTLEARIYPSAR
jgi:tRNA U38,U39,U40 pseudouridine synthase TruA